MGNPDEAVGRSSVDQSLMGSGSHLEGERIEDFEERQLKEFHYKEEEIMWQRLCRRGCRKRIFVGLSGVGEIRACVPQKGNYEALF